MGLLMNKDLLSPLSLNVLNLVDKVQRSFSKISLGVWDRILNDNTGFRPDSVLVLVLQLGSWS